MRTRRRRLRQAITRRAGYLLRKPLPRLAVHFLRRIARAGGDKSAGDVELGAGPLLGILAAPGGFQCLLLLDKYSSLMGFFRSSKAQDLVETSVPDKLLFIAIAMAMTGLVSVLKWDRLLPDAQDYLNLGPLPVPRRTILAANLIAIGITAAAVTLAVNAFSSVLFPAFVSAASAERSIATGQFLFAHAATVSLASLFTFLSVMAIMGAITLATSRSSAGSAGVVARTALLVAFIILIPAAIQVGSLMPAQAPWGMLAWFPPLWFVDLYQQLQSRGPTGMENLAPMVWKGMGAVWFMATACCGILYLRRMDGGAGPNNARSTAGFSRGLVSAFRLATPAARPFEQAIRDFALRALLRSDPHRIILFVALGFGWLIAMQNLVRYPTSPLVPAYLVVLALSIAFRIPGTLSANWAFRVVLDRSVRPVNIAIRQLALLLVGSLVLLPAAVAYSLQGRSWQDSVLLLAHMACMSWVHVELVFGRWRHIPFTRPLEPFRQNFPVKCVLQVLAFALFVWVGSSIYPAILASPALIFGLRWWSRSQMEPDALLSFELTNQDNVQTLELR